MACGPWLLICGTQALEWARRIPPGRHIVGRDADAHVRVAHRSVSRKHAEIVYDEKQLTLRDLGSRNGTFVGDNRIVMSAFTAGDTLRFGNVALDVLATLDGIQLTIDDDGETDPKRQDGSTALDAVLDLLSPTDGLVLRALLDGLAEKQVAARLEMTNQTVHWRVKRVYRALGVHSRAQLSALLPAVRQATPRQT